MGDLILLGGRSAHRARPRRHSPRASYQRAPVRATPIAFFFEPGGVFSYLVGERIERALGDVEWVPTVAAALGRDGDRGNDADGFPADGTERGGCPQRERARQRGWGPVHEVRVRAQARALELQLPLVWPDRFPVHAPGAVRAAAYAAEIGRGARFALAANRLAFCGAFDLEDPEVLAEAAAAAAVPLEGCLAAARDRARDAALWATARGLHDHGVKGLPVLRVGRRWFEGERGVAGAMAMLRARAPDGCPLAPAS